MYRNKKHLNDLIIYANNLLYKNKNYENDANYYNYNDIDSDSDADYDENNNNNILNNVKNTYLNQSDIVIIKLKKSIDLNDFLSNSLYMYKENIIKEDFDNYKLFNYLSKIAIKQSRLKNNHIKPLNYNYDLNNNAIIIAFDRTLKNIIAWCSIKYSVEYYHNDFKSVFYYAEIDDISVNNVLNDNEKQSILKFMFNDFKKDFLKNIYIHEYNNLTNEYDFKKVNINILSMYVDNSLIKFMYNIEKLFVVPLSSNKKYLFNNNDYHDFEKNIYYMIYSFYSMNTLEHLISPILLSKWNSIHSRHCK
jgi:hypothetical protein